MISLNTIIEKVRLYQPILQQETASSAAVMVLLVCDKNGELNFVVTKRSQFVAHYAGDYCFPGGMKEEADADFKITAIREVQEELGMQPENYKIIGQLDDFFDRYNRLVRTYFATIMRDQFDRLVHTSSEIEKLYFLPLQELEKFHEDKMLEEITQRSPAYKYTKDDVVIWGLTANIIVHAYNILFDQNRAIGKGSGPT